MSSKATDLAPIRELMLIEEFKNCISERIAVYLSEHKVSLLQQAATLADEFALIHKTSVIKHERRNASVKVSNVPAVQYQGASYLCPVPRKNQSVFSVSSLAI